MEAGKVPSGREFSRSTGATAAEHVALAANGEQHLRIARLFVQLAPEVCDVHVDRACDQAAWIEMPDVLEDFIPRDRPARVGGEIPEKIGFAFRKFLRLPVVHPDFSALKISDATGELDDIRDRIRDRVHTLRRRRFVISDKWSRLHTGCTGGGQEWKKLGAHLFNRRRPAGNAPDNDGWFYDTARADEFRGRGGFIAPTLESQPGIFHFRLSNPPPAPKVTTHMLLAFNKPYGVLSQFTPDGSPNRPLADFGFPKGVYPIGRLDADSEGLLLLSDEPALNQRLLHPTHGHRRIYWAQVERVPTPEALAKLAQGLVIQGHRALPCLAHWLDPQPAMPPRVPPIRFRKSVADGWIALELVEGKNRQVRRMTAAIGHPTLRLVRVQIGAFMLGDLPPGEWRELPEPDRKAVLANG